MRRGSTAERIRVGISECLLGANVRYDGGHRRDRAVTRALARRFELIAVCPEMELGLGAPRDPMHLEGDADSPRLIVTASRRDLTDGMERFSRKRVRMLLRIPISGFISKARSPSCGVGSAALHRPSRGGRRRVHGLFVAALEREAPLFPVAEDDDLQTPESRDGFADRVIAYERWRCLRVGRPGKRLLIEFHERHRLTLMARSRSRLRGLDRILERVGARPSAAELDAYGASHLRIMELLPTRAKRAAVLRHLLARITQAIEAPARVAIALEIDAYRHGSVEFRVPAASLRRRARGIGGPAGPERTFLSGR